MTYKTHILFAIVIAETSLSISDTNISVKNGLISLFILIISSLLPDIDEEKSKISQIIPLTKLLNLKHRGITHNIFGSAFFIFITYTIISYFQLNIIYFYSFIIGYLSHILGDLLSYSGLSFFLTKKTLKLPGFGHYLVGTYQEIRIYNILLLIQISFFIYYYLSVTSI